MRHLQTGTLARAEELSLLVRQKFHPRHQRRHRKRFRGSKANQTHERQSRCMGRTLPQLWGLDCFNQQQEKGYDVVPTCIQGKSHYVGKHVSPVNHHDSVTLIKRSKIRRKGDEKSLTPRAQKHPSLDQHLARRAIVHPILLIWLWHHWTKIRIHDTMAFQLFIRFRPSFRLSLPSRPGFSGRFWRI